MYKKYYNDENNNDMAIDKILNNTFNTGEIKYETFTSQIKIDDGISSQYDDQLSDNMVEQRVLKMLNEELYEIFKESPFYEKYKNPKRVDKGDMIKMYYYFKNKLLRKNTFTSMEIFIGFAEFFQVNYDQLYNDVGVLDKESILKELNEKYNVKGKIKSKRLF